jgi:hypothetical protein
MKPSDFIADFFRNSEGSIYFCSLPNERNGGRPKEASGRGGGVQLDDMVHRWDLKDRGTFFCVNTVIPNQKVPSRSRDVIYQITSLHADLDLKNIDMEPGAILARLDELQCPPSMVVNSGHGFHAYWLLNEALDATEELKEHVTGLLKRLASTVGGDLAVCEISRLMRLPGSRNTKNGDQLPVTVVVNHGHRYELSDLEDWLSEARPMIPRKGALPRNSNPFLAIDLPDCGGAPVDIEARLVAMHYEGPGDTSIHATQLAVSAAMLNRGHSADETVDAILKATKAAAGEIGARWDWDREERDVRAMCSSWARKKSNGSHATQPAAEIKSASKPEGWRQHALTFQEVQDLTFPPMTYVVDGLIVEGLTILAGRPKVGKSWMALDVCLAVASGQPALGNLTATSGDVLYCALEDNFRRLRSRGEKLLLPYIEWPQRLIVATKWRRLDAGGVTDIAEWCDGVPQPRLVVLDTLASIRPARGNNEAMYDGDYRALLALHQMASERNLAVLVLHHTRKMEADDPLDTISGTLGLAGCADGALIIVKGSQGATLYTRGRDIEEKESAISFDRATCRWSILGDAAEVRRSDGRRAILAALSAAADTMSPQEIAAATGLTQNAVSMLLHRMSKDGEITKKGRGRYGAPLPPERKKE